MRAWTGLVAAVVFLGVGVSDASGKCARPSPWAHPAVGTVLPEDPTLYIFGSTADTPLAVRCTSGRGSAQLDAEVLPASQSEDLKDRVALRVRVDTTDCREIEVRVGDTAYRGAKYRYTVNSRRAPLSSDAAPSLLSAERRRIRLGCGPDDRLNLRADLNASAFSVELRTQDDPTTSTFIVPPLERYSDEFYLGRTMCRGSNVALGQLDQPIQIRLTALHADGSSTQGRWQTVSPPPDYAGPTRSTAFIVDAAPPPEPPPEVPPEPPAPPAPEKPAEVHSPEAPSPQTVPWSWIAAGLLGGLGVLVGSRRLRGTKSPTRPSPP